MVREYPEEVIDVAFSPDGRFLATTSLEGTTRIWDVETGRHLKVLAGHDLFDTTSVTFSPDGGMIATGHGQGFSSPAARGFGTFLQAGNTRCWRGIGRTSIASPSALTAA